MCCGPFETRTQPSGRSPVAHSVRMFWLFFFVSILSLSRFFYYIISISLLYGLFCSWCFAQIERFFISTIQIEVICSSMAAFFGSLCSLKGEKFKWWLFFIAVILQTALGMWMAEFNRKCFTNQVYTCLCVCSERPITKAKCLIIGSSYGFIWALVVGHS